MAVTHHTADPWRQQQLFNTASTTNAGAWTAGTALTLATRFPCTVVTKSRVYRMGGSSTSSINPVNSVYYAPINSSGVIGSWVAGTALPGTVCGAGVLCTKGYVYLIGGAIDASPYYVNTVWRAPVDVDGVIGTFTADTALPGIIGLAQVVTTKNRVYIIRPNTGFTAPINEDGTLGTWASYTPGFTAQNSMVMNTGTRVYLLGGYIDSGYTQSRWAPINTDGTLGSWSQTATLCGSGSSRSDGACVVIGSRYFVFGGYNSSGTVLDTTISGAIDGSGVAAVATATTNLNSALTPHGGCVVTSSRVYLLGGSVASVAPTTNTQSAAFTGGLNDYLAESYDEVFTPIEGDGVFTEGGDTFFGEGSSILPVRYGMGDFRQRANKVASYAINSASIGAFRAETDSVAGHGETSIIGWGKVKGLGCDVAATGYPGVFVVAGSFTDAAHRVAGSGRATVAGTGRISGNRSLSSGLGTSVVPVLGQGAFTDPSQKVSGVSIVYALITASGKFAPRGDTARGVGRIGSVGRGGFAQRCNKMRGLGNRRIGGSILSYQDNSKVSGTVAPQDASPLQFSRTL